MFPLKVMSWNVEHFNGSGGQNRGTIRKRLNRVKRVVEVVKAEQPDVFGLSEVEGSLVYEQLTAQMPGYVFNITEGRQSQEILIGVRAGLTGFFTQRNEFKRNNPFLRPGALLTLRDGDVHVPILFTHLKSMPSPEGFGLRDAMFEKIFALRKELNRVSRRMADDENAESNFIVLGDMNTMGLDYYYSDHDIAAEKEISVMTSKFSRRNMSVLCKTHPATWNNGSSSSFAPSNLDHVIATKHIEFAPMDNNGAHVSVGGWATLNTLAKQDKWIEEYSDHAPLIFEITGV